MVAFERLNCGVLGRNTEGQLFFVNTPLLRWLGYTLEELQGQQVTMLFPHDLDEFMHEELRAIDTGDIRARITILQRKDGTTFPALAIPGLPEKPDDTGHFSLLVELATVQTAKPVRHGRGINARESLKRIAHELQCLSLAAEVPAFSATTLQHPQLSGLSDREKQILAHILAGDRVTNISKRLNISQHTVRSHLKSVYRQLDVGGQAELIEHVRSLE
jgi:PAS domain S-box-containing protein